MVSRDSPIDPVFYIHHAMVDKAWWDWRETFPNSSVATISPSMLTFVQWPSDPINGRPLVDSKSLGVWYAYDHLLNIKNFNFSQDQNFKYSTGSIHIENIELSSTTDMEVYIKQGSGENITIEGPFEAPVGSTLKIDTY